MSHDKPKAEPSPLPSEAELSRIAREAVHQAPDSRLDRQLIRMGVMDATEGSENGPARPIGATIALDPELAHLRDEIRRTKRIVWLLVGIIAILAVIVVGLLAW